MLINILKRYLKFIIKILAWLTDHPESSWEPFSLAKHFHHFQTFNFPLLLMRLLVGERCYSKWLWYVRREILLNMKTDIAWAYFKRKIENSIESRKQHWLSMIYFGLVWFDLFRFAISIFWQNCNFQHFLVFISRWFSEIFSDSQHLSNFSQWFSAILSNSNLFSFLSDFQ